MSAERSGQVGELDSARTGVVAALSLVVAVVLGDSGVVTLALPEILDDFGADVGQVAWVLMALNLVLALAADGVQPGAGARGGAGGPGVCGRESGGGDGLWPDGVRGGHDRVGAGTVLGRADRRPRGSGGWGRAGDHGRPRAARRGVGRRGRRSAAVGGGRCRGCGIGGGWSADC